MLIAVWFHQVYGVRAQNSTSAAPFYEEIAERTGGAYISFNNFSIIADMFLAGEMTALK